MQPEATGDINSQDQTTESVRAENKSLVLTNLKYIAIGSATAGLSSGTLLLGLTGNASTTVVAGAFGVATGVWLCQRAFSTVSQSVNKL